MADANPPAYVEATNINAKTNVGSQGQEPSTGQAQPYSGPLFYVPGPQPYPGSQGTIAPQPYFTPQPFASPPAYCVPPACIGAAPLPVSGRACSAYPAYAQGLPPGYPARVYRDYPEKTSRGLGITQVVVGSICIAIQAVSIAFNSLSGIIGLGIWCGVMFIIAGAFGISAAKRKIKCLVVSFMVLSIISAVMTAVLFSMSIVSAVVDANNNNYYCGGYPSYQYGRGCTGRPMAVAVALNICLTILSLIEAVAAIWGAIICCKTACCCRVEPYMNEAVMLGQYVPAHGDQQAMFLTRQPDGSMMVYPIMTSAISQPSVPEQGYGPTANPETAAIGGYQFPSSHPAGAAANHQLGRHNEACQDDQKLLDLA